MIDVKQANEFISKNIISISEKTVSLEDSLGKILAVDIFATRDLPPFNRVAMDGIALSSSAISNLNDGKLTLKIEDIQAAGDEQKQLKDITKGCLEAMTGATLPVNCDIVIPYEMLEIVGKENAKIATFTGEIKTLARFKNIHRQASDLSKGELVLEKGTLINATIIGILASEGIPKVQVKYAPKIAIISTGSELIAIDEDILPHQIHISNNYTLKAELLSFGFSNTTQYHIADNPELLYLEMKKIIAENDLVLLTGGVSKGKFDYVPDILQKLSVAKVFHKVSQRPGKPLWFGVCEKGQGSVVVFGLPGNPVSALVNLRRHIIPHLISENISQLKLATDFDFKKKLTYFLPVKVEITKGNLQVTPVQTNGSGDYQTLKNSTGFVELKAEQQYFDKDELVNYYPWGKKCL